MFEGDYKLVHHLAPPLTAKKNDKGELIKQPFGPWMRSAFGWLARLKGLRGGALDLFGRTEERRTERALIGEYRACIDELLRTLNADNLRAGGRDRAHPRRDPRLRPREGAPPAGRAAQVGRLDGAVAQPAARARPLEQRAAERLAGAARRRRARRCRARAVQRQRQGRWARWPRAHLQRAARLADSGCRWTMPAWRCRPRPRG